MRKLTHVTLSTIVAAVLGGCYMPPEIGNDPAYSSKERFNQTFRNWGFEGQQMMEDIDHLLLLNPPSRLTNWHVR